MFKAQVQMKLNETSVVFSFETCYARVAFCFAGGALAHIRQRKDVEFHSWVSERVPFTCNSSSSLLFVCLKCIRANGGSIPSL
jgi:hypothetical protein